MNKFREYLVSLIADHLEPVLRGSYGRDTAEEVAGEIIDILLESLRDEKT